MLARTMVGFEAVDGAAAGIKLSVGGRLEIETPCARMERHQFRLRPGARVGLGDRATVGFGRPPVVVVEGKTVADLTGDSSLFALACLEHGYRLRGKVVAETGRSLGRIIRAG
jgi:hypothetical protein